MVERRGERGKRAGAVFLLAMPLVVAVFAASAQPTPTERPQKTEKPNAESPCTVSPHADKGAANDRSLSTTLDDCDGVLKPAPRTADGLVQPAPKVGRTPVIKPKTLPGNPK
ncbi:hypothetical protein [Breoghania corrubedonensis]|nr:hypothetical protein [Breoghania corrubedonensis]